MPAPEIPPVSVFEEQLRERAFAPAAGRGRQPEGTACHAITLVYQEGYGTTPVCACLIFDERDMRRMADLCHLFSRCAGGRDSFFLRSASITEHDGIFDRAMDRAKAFIPPNAIPILAALKRLHALSNNGLTPL